MTHVSRRRLSLFSFGSKDSNLDQKSEQQPSSPSIQSPTIQPQQIQSQSQPQSQSQSTSTPQSPQPPIHSQLPSTSINSGLNRTHSNTSSHIMSPREDTVHEGIIKHSISNSNSPPESDIDIFERSVQERPALLNSRRPTLTKLKLRNSSISLSTTTFKTEDYVPPALDATTSLLNDSKTNLDDIEMVYSSRRNSSVMGLNAALGRSPSRKNSVYSMTALNSNIPQLNTSSNNININASSMINSHSLNSPNSTSNPNSMSGGNSQSNTFNNLNNGPISPTSPPKLTSSKSSISFYSYADLLNNDEFAKRPNFNSSYSQGIIPTRKNSTHSMSNISKNLNNLNGNIGGNVGGGKKFNSSLNKFLISPESSDSEEEKGKLDDNESFISSSVGDCLRSTKAEIDNSQ